MVALKTFSIFPISTALIILETLTLIPQSQAYQIFSSRTRFQNQLDTFILDDYSAPGYFQADIVNSRPFYGHSDASISSVLGETRYTVTKVPLFPIQNYFNSNFIFSLRPSDYFYCGGTNCSSSFLMDFSQTSLGSELGVFGVGFEIAFLRQDNRRRIFAHVTFGDESQQNFSLSSVNFINPGSVQKPFFGITSEQKIKSIFIGLEEGKPMGMGIRPPGGVIGIDNLTIGSKSENKSVPEPSSVVGLLILSSFCFSRLLQRSKCSL